MALTASAEPTAPTIDPYRPAPDRSTFEDLRLREMAAVLLMVILADITIYRGHGFAGVAALYALGPILLLLGAPQRLHRLALAIVGGMLWLLAARLVWYGSGLQVICGVVLLVGFAAALAGRAPSVPVVLVMASQTVLAGYKALLRYVRSLGNWIPHVQRGPGLSIALPVAALIAFSTLFILANPDAVTFLGRQFERAVDVLSNWLVRTTLRPTELLFWLGIAWITAGLLRPVVNLAALDAEDEADVPAKYAATPLYAAFRNTLVTVILLFAVYLILEYKTLWFREFPQGFYYAGYAHQGAAWLTVALGLATLVLSLIFSGRILLDPRLDKLRRLAWVWSLQNLLLSVAVYNRLFIYIGFNGMTRMRIVGLFGISVVVVGFLLVVWKIAREKNFAWLIHRQLWALAITIYVFALTPVDALATSYNVDRILAGDVSASMQIGVKQLDTEGVLALPPLLRSRNAEIREGVRALLAEHYAQLEQRQERRQRLGWTAHQWANQRALARLRPLRPHWQRYEDPSVRKKALEQFYRYAYQWY